ncbi:serine protease snake-like [Anopheles merus]|uniref:serine protease snake-like n=1 Tax=Anopheles merus TaxID=30066 RepID=UPI001BE43C0D|nr:serine protease snake-like [Anopheles merus]
MVLFLPILLSLASLAQGSVFLRRPPLQYTPGNSLDECEQRFPNNKYKLKHIPAAYGGKRAFAGQFQHMAAIGWIRTYYNAYPTIDYLCGGSLITWKFVLTAAHCSADENNIPPDTVRLGDTNLASYEDDSTTILPLLNSGNTLNQT